MTRGIHALGMSEIGSGHDNWLNGPTVIFDLTATNKFWVEMERYHFIDFVSSQSTMHRITKFDLSKSYIKYVDQRMIDIMQEKINEYNRIVETGNDEDKKLLPELYLGILYSNPAGFTLTARMRTNYRQLKTIYRQRHDHRLPEWREFCEEIKELPYSEFITMEEIQKTEEPVKPTAATRQKKPKDDDISTYQEYSYMRHPDRVEMGTY